MKTKTASSIAPAAGALALVLSVFMGASGAGAAQPWTIEGKVVYVDDGDTLILLQADKSKASIRLSDIDAPEVSHGQGRPGQPFSDQSRKSLTEMARGAQASATCYERDRYDRLVCTVFVNGQDLNAEQVRRGMAWATRRAAVDLGGRIGPDYLQGRDISPEELINTFRLRGVQFGESLSEPEKQRWLNEAFGALHDLARVLGFKPSWIGLGGGDEPRLALAIGARGKSNHAAHFEPTLRVINLTRESGAPFPRSREPSWPTRRRSRTFCPGSIGPAAWRSPARAMLLT